MEINNRPLPPLTAGGSQPGIKLPDSGKVLTPPPLTAEQKEALEKLRDKAKEQPQPPVTVTAPKTSLIDEVV
ncbi:hypothetical protein RZO07_19175 [Pseudomonas protegens]|uniref:Uncharacterized protein n=2 Tax=Pseudomonas TaxID=286 RepID=A0A9Q6ICL4_9PSED|nr:MULTISPECIES: hypothetical protein [Pseudomonas]MBS7560375.1 hypothetical protein [Pseudomonas sp. RC4D1]MBW8354029.1 hypothetical protein [Pseudomonas sp.]MCY7260016.1 hypothetical protein [Pseudomonas protegens]MDD1150231.1 hypothetical protein [Pseudomonas idahonensis]MDP9517762.1 hypothetical protein [Pseudomonas protegens]